MTDYFTFTVSTQKFCIPLLNIKEIITHREASPLPGSPGCVEGMIMLRDDVITVIDVKTIFNIFDDVPASHIIIVDFPEGYLGLSIDSVKNVISVDDTNFIDINTLFNKGIEFLNGVVKDDDVLYNSFDTNTLRALIANVDVE